MIRLLYYEMISWYNAVRSVNRFFVELGTRRILNQVHMCDSSLYSHSIIIVYETYCGILGTALTWERLRRHPWLQPRPELPLPKLDGPASGLSRSSSSPGSTV